MEKAWNDARHAREAHPDSTHIFLLCTETAPPSRFDLITRTAGRCSRRHGVQVHLYDCRRIAEAIVDHLLASDSAIDELAEYLPSLSHIRDEYEASLLCPDPGSDYLPRANVEESLSDRLNSGRCVIVAGIGGSGKSQVAAAVANTRREKYDLIIWHDAKEFVRVEQLHSLPIARSGRWIGVAAITRGGKSRPLLRVLESQFADCRLQLRLGHSRTDRGSRLLIRLAMARCLPSAAQPTPIILNDALVYCDSDPFIGCSTSSAVKSCTCRRRVGETGTARARRCGGTSNVARAGRLNPHLAVL
jgi:hypothetical protein